MSLIAQAKILRAIENKEVCPVGGRKSIPINVRFVAATNKNLEQMVEAGEFRADLYYRLNLVRISIPPLRERQEDIGLLLDHYRRILNRKFGKQAREHPGAQKLPGGYVYQRPQPDRGGRFSPVFL
jgi:transcriptional regulator with PAS, ATPase and Fis domain